MFPACNDMKSIYRENCCQATATNDYHSCDPIKIYSKYEESVLRTLMLDSVPDTLEIGTFYDLSNFTTITGDVLCPFIFASTLPHDNNYRMPYCKDVQALLEFVRCPSNTTEEAIESAYLQPIYAAADGRNRLTSSNRVTMPTEFTPVLSEGQMFDMAEIYVLSTLRDTHVDFFHEDNLRASSFCDFLNSFSAKPFHVTPQNVGLFTPSRFPDDGHAGLRVSQISLTPFYNGPRLQDILSRRIYTREDDTFPWTRAGTFAAEEGNPNASIRVPYSQFPSFLGTARALGSAVQSEPVFSHYYDAVLMCISLLNSQQRIFDGVYGIGKILTSLNGGYDDILTATAEIARVALAESYRAKYIQGMKLRPSQLASRIDLMNTIDKSELGQVAQLVDMFFSNNYVRQQWMSAYNASNPFEENFLLKTQYANPTHPSWTHGHATVAGACVTVIKALLRLHNDDGTRIAWPLPPVRSTRDGSDTVLANEVSQDSLTIVGELNKLAYNVAIGRNMAGLHFRTEAEASLNFGESIALAFLKQRACEAIMAFTLSVELFDRRRLKIGCDMQEEQLIPPSDLPAPPFPPFSPPLFLPPSPPPFPMIPPPAMPPMPVMTPLSNDKRVRGTRSNFLKVFPKPKLTIRFRSQSTLNARYLRFTQRQMAHGDSTTRQAKVTVTFTDQNKTTHRLTYGVPTGWKILPFRDAGYTGSCKTNTRNDALGRVCIGVSPTNAIDPAHMQVDLGQNEFRSILKVEYEVLSVYEYTPLSMMLYGGRAYGLVGQKGSSAEALISSNKTSLFYGEGTWDVGLVLLSFHDTAGIIKSQANVINNLLFADGTAIYDNIPGGSAEEDKPYNAIYNPYRPTSCGSVILAGDNKHTDAHISSECLPNTGLAAFLRDRYYVKYNGSGSKLWPCADDDADSIDCSNTPVSTGWSFAGYRVRDGGYGQTFRMAPSATPYLQIELQAPHRLTEVRVRQRNMAFGDATIKRAVVFVDGIERGELTFGEPKNDCSEGTCLTDLTADPFGRDKVADERIAKFSPLVGQRIRIIIVEVYPYTPPANLVDAMDYGYTEMSEQYPEFDEYVTPTEGTWNVGFTAVTLYEDDNRLDVSELSSASFSTDGYYQGFHPNTPFFHDYNTVQSSKRPLPSWCWWGQFVLTGVHGVVDGYMFRVEKESEGDIVDYSELEPAPEP